MTDCELSFEDAVLLSSTAGASTTTGPSPAPPPLPFAPHTTSHMNYYAHTDTSPRHGIYVCVHDPSTHPPTHPPVHPLYPPSSLRACPRACLPAALCCCLDLIVKVGRMS